MRERMCIYQETSLDQTRNTHHSRCLNSAAKNYCGPIHKELCQACPALVPEKVGEATVSLADDIFPETSERSPEMIDNLMETHCKKCKSYFPRTGQCTLRSPTRWFIIRDLMENPALHCAKGAW